MIPRDSCVLVPPHGAPEGAFGVETLAARRADDGEQQLTELVLGVEGFGELNQRSAGSAGFDRLSQRGGQRGEPCPGSPVQGLLRPGQGRQRLRDALEVVRAVRAFRPS